MSTETNATAVSPFPGFQIMPGQPAFYDEARKTWLVFRYADVQRVLSDYATFSNRRGGLDPAQQDNTEGAGTGNTTLISIDPPRHRLYRSLVSQAFTPRMVAQLEPRIHAIVDALLDRVIETGTMDVVDDFSYPLSITVIAEMLGVPASDQAQFKIWTEQFFEITSSQAAQAQRELGTYFLRIFEQRRQQRQDDLVSALLDAQVDGQHLSEIELTSFCSLLLLAGNDTTRHLIANAILCLDQFPEAMTQLRSHMELLPSAIEEVLRYLPSVRSAPRVIAVDTTLDGQKVTAGQWVLPMLPSANRDESVFSRATIFDVGRTPNRHLTFGYGIHFCLGAPLARLESKIALTHMLDRLGQIERVRSVPLEPVASPVVYGMKHVPITFKKS
jgi:cytochrome P450